MLTPERLWWCQTSNWIDTTGLNSILTDVQSHAVRPGGAGGHTSHMAMTNMDLLEFKNLGFKEIHLSGILKSESSNTLDSDLKTIEEIVSKTK